MNNNRFINDKKIIIAFIVAILVFTSLGFSNYNKKIQISELQTDIANLKSSLTNKDNDISKIKEQYEKLEDDYTSYKTKMKPYEELHAKNEELKKTKKDYSNKLKKLQFLSSEELENFNSKLEKSKNITDVENTFKLASKKDKEVEELSKNKATSKLKNLKYLDSDKKENIIKNIESAETINAIDNLIKNSSDENDILKNKAKENIESSSSKKQTTKTTSNKQDNIKSQEVGETANGQVYITKTGKRYHSRACGRGTYFPINLSQAKSKGLTPCKKCY